MMRANVLALLVYAVALCAVAGFGALVLYHVLRAFVAQLGG